MKRRRLLTILKFIGFHSPLILWYSCSKEKPLLKSLQLNPFSNLEYYFGECITLSWESRNIDLIKIEYTLDGLSWSTIQNHYQAEIGSYKWIINIEPIDVVRFRIMDIDDNLIGSVSSNIKVIQAPKSLDILIAENQLFNDYHLKLKWKSQYVDYINLSYSTNDGTTWNKIVTSLPSSQEQYIWKIENIHAPSIRFKIEESTNLSLSSTSKEIPIIKAIAFNIENHFDTLNEGLPVLKSINAIGTIAIFFNEENAYTVLSLTCPHNACTVEYIQLRQRFECPCHGAAFEKNGCLLIGPAEEALLSYESVFDKESQDLFIILEQSSLAC